MKNNACIIFFFIICHTVSAQTYADYPIFKRGTTLGTFTTGQPKTVLSEMYLYLDTSSLKKIILDRPAGLGIVLPQATQPLSLNLRRVELFNKGFQLIAAGNALPTHQNNAIPPPLFYTGTLSGIPNSKILLTIAASGLTGLICSNDLCYSLEMTSSTDESAYRLVNVTNLPELRENEQYVCATKDTLSAQVTRAMQHITGSDALASSTIPEDKMVNIHFECDYAMYQALGANPQRLLNYVATLFTVVHTLFRNEGIIVRIQSIRYWTSTDPYADRTAADGMLDDLGAEFQAGIPSEANLVHLISTRNAGGGIAWLDVLCTTPFYYSPFDSWVGPFAVSTGLAINTVNRYPSYSWSAMVITHEIGHNLGSPHTHTCAWNGNNTALDNCSATEGGCPPGPAPTNGGTIMSYCHQRSNIGINFQNGFGPQPGALIRAMVANSSCLTASSDASVAVTPNTATHPHTGSTSNISISTTPSGLFWAASTSANWLTLSATAGQGTSVLAITSTANQNSSARTATIIVESEQTTNLITITQSAFTVLAAPSNLLLTPVSPTQINLSWTDNASDEMNYSVERSTNISGPWTEIISGLAANTTTYSALNLTPNTTYYFRVRASSASSFSAYSNVASTTTPENLNCSLQVANLSICPNTAVDLHAAVSLSNNQVALSFFSSLMDAQQNTAALSNSTVSISVATTYYARAALGNCVDIKPISLAIADCTFELRLKVMLQGAFVASSALMRDSLRAKGFIPLNDPYSTSANPRFVHAGIGAVATTNHQVLRANIGTANAIVDWVFVELRNPNNSNQILQTQAALLQRDGDVVSPIDGTSPLYFPGTTGSSAYIAIKHRNHLGVMTAAPLPLQSGVPLIMDFTLATFDQIYHKSGYDGYEMATIAGVKALWAGDVSSDGSVKYAGVANDAALILSFVLRTSSLYNSDLVLAYANADANLDGKIKYAGLQNDLSSLLSSVINYGRNMDKLYNYSLLIEQIP